MATSRVVVSSIIVLSMSGCSALLLSFLTISLCVKIWSHHKELQDDPSASSLSAKAVQYSSVVALSVGSMHSLTTIIEVLYVQSTDTTFRDAFNPFRLTQAFFVGIGYISLYFFLVCRLYVTFTESVYAIKPIVIKAHVINAVCCIILFIISGVAVFSDVLPGNERGKAIFAILAIWNAFPLIHLEYAFNSRLFRLVLSQRRTILGKADAVQLSQAQIEILQVVRKHTLLGGLMFVMLIVGVLSYSVGLSVTNNSYEILYTYPHSRVQASPGLVVHVFDFCLLVAVCVCAMCVYLGFTVNDGYFEIVCHPLDMQCKALCQRMVENRMQHDAVDAIPIQVAGSSNDGITLSKMQEMVSNEDSTESPSHTSHDPENAPWLKRVHSLAV